VSRGVRPRLRKEKGGSSRRQDEKRSAKVETFAKRIGIKVLVIIRKNLRSLRNTKKDSAFFQNKRKKAPESQPE